jgi:uncharacterized protein YceK
MKTILVLAVVILFQGCASTTYITTKTDGSKTEVSASSFLVKRTLGKVQIGSDSLDGSTSDQMQAASDALTLAAQMLSKAK